MLEHRIPACALRRTMTTLHESIKHVQQLLQQTHRVLSFRNM